MTDTLSAIRVKDGQQVRQGEVLFELTRQEEQAQLNQARAQLIEAQEQFARADRLQRPSSHPPKHLVTNARR